MATSYLLDGLVHYSMRVLSLDHAPKARPLVKSSARFSLVTTNPDQLMDTTHEVNQPQLLVAHLHLLGIMNETSWS
jgi:hypothetical protein